MDKISNKSNKASRGHPFLSGFIAGVVLGVLISAAVVIYVVRSPSPFQNRALDSLGVGKDIPTPIKPQKSAADATPSDENPASEASVSSAVDKPAVPTQPGNLYIQVGAFGSNDDAEKQVETIAAITGVHAKMVTGGSEASKSMVRVRIGPFNHIGETTELTQILKSNSIPYALVRPAAGEVIH